MRTEVCDVYTDKKIRVILVDEREVMREGLRHMLSRDADISVVGEAEDGPSALVKAKALQAHILLMGVGVKGISGIKAASSLSETQSPLGVIILADDRKYLAPAIEAGAVGFLPRSISRDHLIEAIRIVHLWCLSLFENERSHFALIKL